MDDCLYLIDTDSIYCGNGVNFTEERVRGEPTRAFFTIKNCLKVRNRHLIRTNVPLPHASGQFTQCGFQKLYNNITFQQEDSECGVYSIFFQTQMLTGKSFHHVITNIIDDNTINQQRNYYFREDD